MRRPGRCRRAAPPQPLARARSDGPAPGRCASPGDAASAGRTPPPPDNRERARQLWGQAAADLRGTPAQAYLARRGLWKGYDPTELYPWAKLRWHGSNCLVAAINDPTGRLVAVHRIYLDSAGRKRAQSAKLSLGPIRGNACRLADWRITDTLALAEGLEDALAFQILTGTPTWAACGAGFIPAMILPEATHNVIIAADGDPPGLVAAAAARAALEAQGRSVRVLRAVGAKDPAELAERSVA